MTKGEGFQLFNIVQFDIVPLEMTCRTQKSFLHQLYKEELDLHDVAIAKEN